MGGGKLQIYLWFQQIRQRATVYTLYKVDTCTVHSMRLYTLGLVLSVIWYGLLLSLASVIGGQSTQHNCQYVINKDRTAVCGSFILVWKEWEDWWVE